LIEAVDDDEEHSSRKKKTMDSFEVSLIGLAALM
jgi:hypothetical protein